MTETPTDHAGVPRWSVSLRAEGDRAMSREEIVELADAVAAMSGVASGIGTASYGAQIVVAADHPAEAATVARRAFATAVSRAGLPAWPVEEVRVVGEDDDPEDIWA